MNDYGHFTYDTALEMKASGAITASTDGSILDLGEGLFDGFLVIDLAACEVDTGDEQYTVSVEGSDVAAMDSGSVCLAKKVFGNPVAPMDAALSAPNRYVVPFRNEEGGSLKRYVRLSTAVAGTVTTGIDFSAFLAKR